MKLKINKACDLGSISVLPPRTGGSSGAGASGSSAAAAVGSQPHQPRSQTMSQQSFSQVGGGSGGGSSFLHSQSQLSQGSLDENLLTLHLASPPRDQRFGSHDGASKKMPSLPINSASGVTEESQLQLAKISSNPVHRWNPSLPDSRCQVPNEDVERKFQHLASSVHKMGMVIDSVQNDCMQLNRAMKEASLDSGSIQQKVVLLDNSIQKIGVVRAIRSLNGRPAATQMPTDQSCTTSERYLMNLQSAANERPIMNLQPAANERPQMGQTPVATLVTQTPANGRPLVTQTPIANGRSLTSQMPAANAKALMGQTQVENGRPLMSQLPAANGQSQTNQKPIASGRRHSLGLLIDARTAASLACPAKVADPKLKTDQGKTKALPQKLTGSGTRVIPKQEGVPNRKVTRQGATKKAPPVMIIIDSDDDSDGRATCVILKTQTGAGGEEESLEMMKHATEETQQILRRARKRRRREMQAIVPTT
ncbi:hypothetical protein EJB05_08329 [Eragrostis curvula]|uniref:Protein PAIR1 n=1 Tax=Eragrostis curvula TaxID=38414 RepID=A0A5J9WN41_9POAL|nr:hypothetical protein EJB05_08329 [Eragrostis curvula]